MIETNRKPTTVGEVLTAEFLSPMRLSQVDPSQALGVEPQIVNELCCDRRAMTAGMALKLSGVFGNSAEFWLNIQQAWDSWFDGQKASENFMIGREQPDNQEREPS